VFSDVLVEADMRKVSVNRGGNTKYNALVPRVIPGGESFFVAFLRLNKF
jgi:hypothetical protein